MQNLVQNCSERGDRRARSETATADGARGMLLLTAPLLLLLCAMVACSYAKTDWLATVGWEIERGRVLVSRTDASTVAGRAQRGAGHKREGAFGKKALFKPYSSHTFSRETAVSQGCVLTVRVSTNPAVRFDSRVRSKEIAQILPDDSVDVMKLRTGSNR